ncbi:MAG TPA: polyprenyl synthetase family protein, partial [Burkholderiales bacterium]|nr:polyprenyl synthetase family protein [Burkholderiales bacterium]
DDVLDQESSTATLGKTAGKDAANNKPTYVSVLGLARAKALAEELREEAQAALSELGSGARRLSELADFIVLRKF